MRILIQNLSARRGGGQTYLKNLLGHLDQAGDLEVFLVVPKDLALPAHTRVKRLEINWPTDNPWLRAWWEKRHLPRLLGELHIEVLFCPGGLINTTPPNGCRTVTMFRNMIPFDTAVKAQYPLGMATVRNFLLERLMLRSMIQADLVIFISDFARQVIDKASGGRVKWAVTIPHGLSDHFRQQPGDSPRPDFLPSGEYLLYVSIFDYYKNQMEVVRAYHLLCQKRVTEEKLLLAGLWDTAYGRRVQREIQQLGLETKVILTGNVPYEQLPAVYRHAKLNIFASECENCPNILLEALGAGRAVLSSNRAPMPEFGGTGAIYFDPDSPADLAEKIASVIDQPLALEAWGHQALTRSHDFNWEETARRTWEAIRTI